MEEAEAAHSSTTGLEPGSSTPNTSLDSALGRWRVGAHWYAIAVLTSPVLLLVVLLLLRALAGPAYTPKFLAIGVLYGLPGVLEEVGWMGFAFPRMQAKHSALVAALILGVLWGLWHAPVVDYLGAAAPHGVYWLPFFLAFIAVVTAMRILMVWVYASTGSLVLAQVMHVSMAGSLVILGPAQVSAAQETLWYWAYAAVRVMGTIIVQRDPAGNGEQPGRESRQVAPLMAPIVPGLSILTRYSGLQVQLCPDRGHPLHSSLLRKLRTIAELLQYRLEAGA